MRSIVEHLLDDARARSLDADKAHTCDSRPGAARFESPCPGGADAATVAVADDGPGIPTEHRDDVFRRCWTTDPTSSGIGLAIFSEAAHIAFEVELTTPTSPAGGTTITLRMPTRQPKE